MKYIKKRSDLLNYAKDEKQKEELQQLMSKRLKLELILGIITLIFILLNFTIDSNSQFTLFYITTIIIIILNFYLLILDISDDIDLTEYSKLYMTNVIFITSKTRSILRFISFMIFILIFIALQLKILL